MICILIVLLIILIFIIFKKENFTNDLSDKNKNKIVNEIVNNMGKFNNQNLNLLKKEYKWMDPIIYEDIKQLIKNNHLTRENLTNKIFI
jgi:hypothetical protein